MTRKLKKITIIDDSIKTHLNRFKESLIEQMNDPTITSAFDAETIRIILQDLDDAERNLILAHYGVCDGDACETSKVFNCCAATIENRIIKIRNKIILLNDTPKTIYNCPRECSDN